MTVKLLCPLCGGEAPVEERAIRSGPTFHCGTLRRGSLVGGVAGRGATVVAAFAAVTSVRRAADDSIASLAASTGRLLHGGRAMPR